MTSFASPTFAPTSNRRLGDISASQTLDAGEQRLKLVSSFSEGHCAAWRSSVLVAPVLRLYTLKGF
jgi:hypothetical protein